MGIRLNFVVRWTETDQDRFLYGGDGDGSFEYQQACVATQEEADPLHAELVGRGLESRIERISGF